MSKKRALRKRVIDRLREAYPGRWTYDQRSFAWEHEDGWRVRRYARHTPRYEGDDDTFVTEYRRDDTGEIVPGLNDSSFSFGGRT